MKIKLDDGLVGYDGREIVNSPEDQTSTTIRKVLEIALLQADPVKWSTGDQKYEIYRMLKRLTQAEEEINFEAKDVVLLKEVLGATYNPPIVGAVFDLLDPPADE